MLVRTDDEVYRVDSVWLGPPRATFPWRARYVSYGVGLLVMVVVMFVQRRVGIGLDFFSVAWALVLTVLLTRFLGKRIDYERPLGQVLAHFRYELTGPRARTAVAGGAVRSGHVRVGPAARSARKARMTEAARSAAPTAVATTGPATSRSATPKSGTVQATTAKHTPKHTATRPAARGGRKGRTRATT